MMWARDRPIGEFGGLVSAPEVPVFLERVFTDQGVTDVELAILRVYGCLGFVSDRVAV